MLVLRCGVGDTRRMLAQTETIVKSASEFVDKAAAQNDRWLFLAALVILLFFVGVVIRWLVAHITEKDISIVEKEARHDAERKEARSEFLKALNDQRADFRAELQTERQTVVASLTRLAELTMEHVKEARAYWNERNNSPRP